MINGSSRKKISLKSHNFDIEVEKTLTDTIHKCKIEKWSVDEEPRKDFEKRNSRKFQYTSDYRTWSWNDQMQKYVSM